MRGLDFFFLNYDGFEVGKSHLQMASCCFNKKFVVKLTCTLIFDSDIFCLIFQHLVIKKNQFH